MKKANFTSLVAMGFCFLAMLFTSSVNAQAPAGSLNVDIVVTGGGFPAEVSWTLSDAGGAAVATGTPGTTTAALVEGDSYDFQGFDSFGDGWNGATATITINDDGSGGACDGSGLAGVELLSGYTFTTGTDGPVQAFTNVNCPNCELQNVPADIVIDSEPGQCGAQVTIATPTASADCAGIVTVYAESFDAGVNPGGAWSVDDGTGTPGAYTGMTSDGGVEGNAIFFDGTDSGATGAAAPFAGAYLAVVDDGPVTPENLVGLGYAVTPTIDLSTAISPVLSFDWENDDFAGQGDLLVDVWDGATWVNILDVQPDAVGSESNIDLSPYAAVADFSIRFGYDDEGGFAWGMAIDNILITGTDPNPTVNNNQNATMDASGFYDVGTTAVVFSTFDATGIPVTATVNVTVNDVEAPVFTCPADQLIDLGPGECDAVVTYNVSATDNCPVTGPAASVETGFPGGNGFAGNMVNISNVGTETIQISSFDVNMAVGTSTMEIYFTTTATTYQAVAGNAAEWTLLGTLDVTSTAANAPTAVAIGGLTLAPGDAKGLYVTSTTNTINYTNTNINGATVFSDGTLEIDANNGIGGAYPFNLNFSPRIWNGRINYATFSNDVPVVQTAGLASGETFPIGVTTVSYDATDDAGNTATCSFDVEVTAFSGQTAVLACNDNVQISIDATGVVTVGADMILEGGPYGCYDDYIVNVNNTGSNVVDCTEVGETVTVMVTDPATGNSCWGSITLEDKLAPTIICADLTIGCTDDIPEILAPADGTITFTGNNLGAEINNTLPAVVSTVEVSAAPGATVLDINVPLNITHTWAGDLNITLESPSGTQVSIWGGFCGAGDNLNFVADDEGTVTNQCVDFHEGNQNVTFPGLVPNPALSIFDGEDPTGTWTFTITDGVGGDNGTLDNIQLEMDIDQPDDLVSDNCSVESLTFVDSVAEGDCSGDAGTITRVWTATDPSGNSVSCTQTITIVRPTVADVTFPSNFDDLDQPSLDCANVNGWDTNGNGYPDVSETGVPQINGGDIVNGDICGLTYSQIGEDVVIDICATSFKVRREWLVIDWCTGDEVEMNQLIKVLDSTGPSVVCPTEPLTTINVYSANGCLGNVTIPAIEVTGDDCSGVDAAGSFTEIWTLGGVDLLASVAGNGGTISGIDLVGQFGGNAQYTVRHLVADNCGNQTECQYDVELNDRVAPIAVCDEITDLSLTNGGATGEGCSTIFAADLDDGSYDNCGQVYFLAAKMNPFFNQPFTQLSYTAGLEYCCSDIGENMAVLLVLDFDPAPFMFNGTLFLSVLPTDVYEGHVNNCMVTINVEDKLPPVNTSCPANATIDCDTYLADYSAAVNAGDFSGLDADFGVASFYDNCGFTPASTTVVNIDNCAAGTITRNFTATDADGNTATCSYTITVNHVSDWQVQFPADVNAQCTAGSLPAFGEPSVFNDECELIGTSFEDTQYDVVPDACYKIVREYSVINWCIFDQFGADVIADPQVGTRRFADGGDGFITYQQVIKVQDNEAPTFTIADIDGCIVDNTCQKTVVLPFPTNMDDCSDEFEVDIDGDLGFFNDIQGDVTVSDLDPGTYTVFYNVTDECGNFTAESVTFDVADCKKPTPYCVNGVIMEIMQTGMIEVWASDLDAGSFDNCTATGDLKVYFNNNPALTALTFDCSQLGENNVELWIEDEAGNKDFCITQVYVQDNMAVCGDASIAGTVATEDDVTVQDASIDLNGGSQNVVTAQNGNYAFDVEAGLDVSVTPMLDENYLNGVTTYDLVLISKHILGVTPFDSPYKHIAADANNSGSVTTYDMVVLRRLILLIDTELANNTSWRFVDAGYVFPSTTNPWLETFPEVLNYNNLDEAIINADFVGVKIGDVNGSANANAGFSNAQERTNENLVLTADNATVTAGQNVTVEFTASDLNVEGFQFTLNHSNLELVEIIDGVATAENFGIKADALTASWNGKATNEVLFTAVFTATADVTLSEVMSLNSRYTAAEAYNANGEAMNVNLEFNATAGFELFQNVPNPSNGVTTISFNLPTAAAATLTINDINGKVISVINVDGAKGYNNVQVSDLTVSGVLYYTLESADMSATRKMVIVK